MTSQLLSLDDIPLADLRQIFAAAVSDALCTVPREKALDVRLMLFRAPQSEVELGGEPGEAHKPALPFSSPGTRAVEVMEPLVRAEYTGEQFDVETQGEIAPQIVVYRLAYTCAHFGHNLLTVFQAGELRPDDYPGVGAVYGKVPVPADNLLGIAHLAYAPSLPFIVAAWCNGNGLMAEAIAGITSILFINGLLAHEELIPQQTNPMR